MKFFTKRQLLFDKTVSPFITQAKLQMQQDLADDYYDDYYDEDIDDEDIDDEDDNEEDQLQESASGLPTSDAGVPTGTTKPTPKQRTKSSASNKKAKHSPKKQRRGSKRPRPKKSAPTQQTLQPPKQNSQDSKKQPSRGAPPQSTKQPSKNAPRPTKQPTPIPAIQSKARADSLKSKSNIKEQPVRSGIKKGIKIGTGAGAKAGSYIAKTAGRAAKAAAGQVATNKLKTATSNIVKGAKQITGYDNIKKSAADMKQNLDKSLDAKQKEKENRRNQKYQKQSLTPHDMTRYLLSHGYKPAKIRYKGKVADTFALFGKGDKISYYYIPFTDKTVQYSDADKDTGYAILKNDSGKYEIVNKSLKDTSVYRSGQLVAMA